jgi:CofD-related protein of GAK system
MATAHSGRTLADLILVQRIEALRKAPALGPALLFFSGGTALRPLCRKLKLYTHHSVHIITPFDSGGSSAEIRRTLAMLSLGDLRNRLLALADENSETNGSLYKLFCYRLPKHAPQIELWRELHDLSEGGHALVRVLPAAVQGPITSTLQLVVSLLPPDVDLAGANIGNLVLAGTFLSHDRDIHTALMLMGKMVGVLGRVLPSSEANAQLAARLRDGQLIVGQHRITGKQLPAIASPVTELFLTAGLDSQQPVEVAASSEALQQIAEADLICYSYGSFYSSVLANLLPKGIARAIVTTRCPKIYVPNWGTDPEQLGMTLADTVDCLIERVRREAPTATVRDVIQRVVLDSVNLDYSLQLDVERVRALGIEVIDVPFAAEQQGDELDFTRLAELLVSLS